jgi:hypothetical protein
VSIRSVNGFDFFGLPSAEEGLGGLVGVEGVKGTTRPNSWAINSLRECKACPMHWSAHQGLKHQRMVRSRFAVDAWRTEIGYRIHLELSLVAEGVEAEE